MFRLSALIVIALLSMCAQASTETTPRIIGGSDASAGDWPWKTALVLKNSDNLFCGATLIAPRWVLTAAHCITNGFGTTTSPNSIQALINRHNLSINTGERINIIAVVPHPLYNPNNSDSDIALLRLESASTNTPIIPISQAQMTGISSGDLAAIIGWGSLDEGGTSFPNVLQEASVPYVSNTVCDGPLSYDGTLTDNMICAGYQPGGVDSCQGDSGGPLMSNIGGTWYQTGIVSFGFGCARANYYGVYTKVSVFQDWINQVTSGTHIVQPKVLRGAGIGNDQMIEITAYNYSGTTQTLSFPTISGPNAVDFNITSSACPGTLSDNHGCTIYLAFNASSAGKKSAILTLPTTPGSSGTAALTGWGLTLNTDANTALGDTKNWYTGGDASWHITNAKDTSFGGAMQSGDINDNEESILSTQLTGPSTYQFALQTSSEQYFDYADIYLDGELKASQSGNTNWCVKSVSVPSGTHLLHIVYNKDSSVSSYSDASYIDVYTGTESTSCPQRSNTTSFSGGGGGGGGGGGSFSPPWLIFLGLSLSIFKVYSARKNTSCS